MVFLRSEAVSLFIAGRNLKVYSQAQGVWEL